MEHLPDLFQYLVMPALILVSPAIAVVGIIAVFHFLAADKN